MKVARISAEEKAILTRMTLDQLRFLDELADLKDFHMLIDIVNDLIDHEKNIFFSEREIQPEKLAVLHAFSRGGIAKLAMLIHIIGSAKAELSVRKKD